MIRLLASLLLLAAPAFSLDQYFGWCEQGNYSVVTQGINSSTKVQRSFPSCTITVYTHGTSTPLPLIYADNNGTPTPLANPFTANTDGSFQFFAPNGRYDVNISGGGLPTPLMVYNVLLCDPQDNSGLFTCSGAGTGPTWSVYHNGTLVGTQNAVNIDDTATIGATISNDVGNNRIQITLDALSGFPHDLLSTTHPDTTPAAVTRGAMVVGVGSTPSWTLVAKGTANQMWAMDGTGTDPGWINRLEPVDVGVTFNSTPTASMPLVRHPFPFAVDIATDCPNSALVAATAATASSTFSLLKCTSVGSCSSFGTAVFGIGGQAATFTCTATSFAKGDILLMTSPGTPDATLAGLGGTVYGTRAGGL